MHLLELTGLASADCAGRARESAICLRTDSFPVTLHIVNMHIDLPEELVAQIDAVANDRSAFVAEAIRRLLREPSDVADKRNQPHQRTC